MEMKRAECVALLLADLLHARDVNGAFANPITQCCWDDLLGYLDFAYDLRGRVPDQPTVLRVRNRLLAAGGDAILELREDDYSFAIGLLVWLIRDCGVPYDHTLSLHRPTVAHLDAHRVALQFEHLQRRGRPAIDLRD